MTEKFGRLALHTWTIDTTPLGPALEAIRLAGYDAAELRRTDFKRCYEAGMTNDEVVEMVKNSGVKVGVLGVEYGWLFATGAESKRIFEDFRVSCQNAVVLGCPQLMSAPGPFTGSLKAAVGHLRTAADIAAEYDLKLSIEFNSQHANLNSVETLRELVTAADRKNVGLLFDAYHLARSGRPGRGFEDVPGEDIMHFQFSDLSPNPVTGVKRPTDRLMPGKGVLLWQEIFELLHEKGYTGLLSFEAPNPEQWDRPPVDVCKEGVELTQGLLRSFVSGFTGEDGVMARVELPDGALLNTRVDGPEGAPWVVLSNSVGADLSMWDGQIEMLTRKYRVLRYDQRGHGASDAPPGPYSFDLLVGDVIALMDHHDISRADWIGLSLGAMIGMGLAIHHRRRFGRLVLADGRAEATDAYKVMWDERIAAVDAAGVESVADGSLGLWFTEDWRNANPEATAAARVMIAATNAQGYIACCHALRELDYLKDLRKVTLPVLYICGGEDKGAPPEVMRAIAQATPGSKYVEIPHAGHVANVNQPTAFNTAVAHFLDV